MPCLTVPLPTLPTLPSPLTLPVPDAPDVSPPETCCKLPTLPIPAIPITIPSVIVNPALVVTMKQYQALMRAYLDQIPVECPKE